MNNEDFNVIFDGCIEMMKSTLQRKTGEYVRDGERFHNFKVAGRRRGISPERALAGMKEKHCVSVEDIIDDIDKGVLPTIELVDEKIGDELNYLVLLKGLIIERIRKSEYDKSNVELDKTVSRLNAITTAEKAIALKKRWSSIVASPDTTGENTISSIINDTKHYFDCITTGVEPENDFVNNIPGAIQNVAETNKNPQICDNGASYYGVGLSKNQAKRISNALKYKFDKNRELKNKMTSIPLKKSTKRKVGKK